MVRKPLLRHARRQAARLELARCGLPRRSAGWPLPRLGRAILAALMALTFAGPALAQGAVRSVHEDWQIRCDTPPGAQKEPIHETG